MSMPCGSLPDPEIQGEISIDTLGLMSAADNLADLILPGLLITFASALIIHPCLNALNTRINPSAKKQDGDANCQSCLSGMVS